MIGSDDLQICISIKKSPLQNVNWYFRIKSRARLLLTRPLSMAPVPLNFPHCIICYLDFRSGGEWQSLAKWRYLPSLCLQSGMFYELNKYNKRGDTSLPCKPKTDQTRSLKLKENHLFFQDFILTAIQIVSWSGILQSSVAMMI